MRHPCPAGARGRDTDAAAATAQLAATGGEHPAGPELTPPAMMGSSMPERMLPRRILVRLAAFVQARPGLRPTPP
jgi:hypothetical protein